LIFEGGQLGLSSDLIANTKRVAPLEQKRTILVKHKGAKADAICITYSTKIKRKIQVMRRLI
jgi:hypothetical protein